MTPETWDYIFARVNKHNSKTMPPKEKCDRLRREFEYWYGVDLRVSGKDLIQVGLLVECFLR